MTNVLTIDAPTGLPFISGTREFDVPPELVFRAWTDRDLIVQWLGPRRLTMRVEQWDAREGGSYRYVHSDDNGEYGFRGSFHTVRPNELLIQTFEWDGAPDVVSLDVLRFVDLGGRTRIEQHSTFPSLEARDGIVAGGMETGLREGYERLDELLARS